ncbi:hypothetical protein GIB67_042452 [Kingdonia uniflora]|uniref:Protein EXORDIUM-like 2 n=1 Tax=Kingdonia uniflora TaxID=39325 RepID=A0A7J7M0U5_9MAGN|nr:hypothetical protein GIB67_042452 [Kingdonia uniflora]
MAQSLLFITTSSILLVFLIFPIVSWANNATPHPVLKYRRGPILRGELKLGILWYGRFGRTQKVVLRDFIRSLNSKGGSSSVDPTVSKWWSRVEQYQSAVLKRNRNRIPKIRVRIVKQKTDKDYSIGKILMPDFFPGLVEKAKGGVDSAIAVIFTDRQVSIVGTCMGQCSRHGVIGKGPSKSLYMVVGNPETECPGTCAWPFHKADFGPQTLPLQPPNGNVGSDAMVIGLATSLAGTVTNPYNSGFFQGPENEPLEAVSACAGIFGSGAFPGYAGKVHIAPGTGGCFNARGTKGRKFLLPAVWDPKTKSCWTLM